ncbi:hypothetical protein OKW11_006085 [Pseudomonas baetica]|nr:hypothetical protein [Pseudomonas baetica]
MIRIGIYTYALSNTDKALCKPPARVPLCSTLNEGVGILSSRSRYVDMLS